MMIKPETSNTESKYSIKIKWIFPLLLCSLFNFSVNLYAQNKSATKPVTPSTSTKNTTKPATPSTPSKNANATKTTNSEKKPVEPKDKSVKTAQTENVKPSGSAERVTEIKLTGKVKNEAGDNLVGASIVVKGKDVGVVSDATGQFTINVQSNDTLVVTSLGMEDMLVAVRKQKRLYVNMLPKLGDLSGVNTLLGPREAITVGFDYQQNIVDYLQNDYDFLDGLHGRVEGVEIVRSSGVIGAQQRIKFRGVGSTLNNEPLIVVDGVPISYSVYSPTDGVDVSSRLFDINPNDIAMITFLKSASALALYGSRGGNGAILITTKRGRNGPIQIMYGSNVRFDFVKDLPQKQELFGFFDETNPNLPATSPYNLPSSWATSTIGNIPNALTGGTNPYWNLPNSNPDALVNQVLFNSTAQNNQLKDMYGAIGFAQNHQLSLFGGKGRFKTFSSLSYSRGESELAAIPGTGFSRFTFRFNGASELNDKINVDFSSAISSLRGNKIRKGYAGHSFSAYNLPSNFDVSNNDLYDLFYNTPNPFGSNNTPWSTNAYDLPQEISENIFFYEAANHFMASGRFTYNFTKPNQDPLKREEMFLVHRVGVDYSALKTQHFVPGNSLRNDYVVAATSPGFSNIAYDEQLRLNTDLYFNYFKNFSNKHSIKGIGGLSYSGLDASIFSVVSAQQDPSNPTNYRLTTVGDLPYQQHNLGIVMRGEYAFKKLVYTSVSLRHDFNFDYHPYGGYGNSAAGGQLYPGLDVAFVFTQLSKQSGKKGFGPLSYGRLRASAGMVGNSPTPENFAYYSANVNNTFDYDPVNFQVLGMVNNGPNNFQIMSSNGAMYPYKNQNVSFANDLRPETKYGFDGGFDLGFLEDRFMIKSTYFYEMLRGGFLLRRSDEDPNITELRNMVDVNAMGVDFAIDFKIVSNQYLDWNLGLNALWTTNKVVNVKGGDTYLISDVNGAPGIGNVVTEGYAYGAIYGTTWDLAPGQFWDPTTAKKQEVIGNPLPWVTLGLSNQFNFYGVGISFVLQAKLGGDMWNGTQQYMNMYGTGKETENRDQVNAVPVDPAVPLNTAGEWNDASLTYWTVYNSASSAGIQEDVHWIKLRDVTISYTRNVKNQKSFLKSYQVYAKGKDLWMWTNYNGSTDPDIASGATYRTYGIDFYPTPLTRAVIVGFKLTF